MNQVPVARLGQGGPGIQVALEMALMTMVLQVGGEIMDFSIQPARTGCPAWPKKQTTAIKHWQE